ncbi:hypothetical protein SUGI_0337740 [Cryptomeria japonica]|nr:hypothetical protein SUGI_0337740 [Cryptomeria japonica]
MTTMMIGRLQVKATRVDMQRVWSRNMTNAVHRGNARLNRLETPITGEVSLAADLGVPVKRGQHVGEFMMTMVPLGVTQDNLPNVTFHMGGGADYVVEGKYNFALVDPDKDLLCLLMLEMAQESAAKVPSILGNFQQQNIHILFDNDNEEISFTPASCSDLSQPDFDKRFMVSGSPASTLALVSFIVIFIFHFINSTLS